MRKIYICATGYHVLITLVKVLTSNECCDIVLSPQVPQQMDMHKKLVESNIFENVYYYHQMTDEFNLAHNKLSEKQKGLNILSVINKKINLIETNYDFEFLNNKEIFIFNDSILIGQYINFKKVKYNIVEDGLDCLLQPLFYELHAYKKGIKGFIKQILGIQIRKYGYSQYVKTIEVNNKIGVKVVSEKKLIEENRKNMFSKLKESDKSKILDIFIKEKIIFYNDKKTLLLLTQPLFVDGKLKSELSQIEMYKEMISEYSAYQLVIKPHPRDKIDYKKYFENCLAIIDSTVPAEVLSFIDAIDFDLAITAYSTSIADLDFVKEKVTFGSDYVINFEKTLNCTKMK